MVQSRNIPIIILLGTAACGPSKLEAGSTDDGSGSGSETTTAESSESSESSETSQDTSLEATTSPGVFVRQDTPPSECDPWLQDCPEGEKCVPWGNRGSWDANKCVLVTGAGQPGDTCTWGGLVEATDDCDATSACWNAMAVDGELVGVCHAFCSGTPEAPECPEGEQCFLTNNGAINLCDAGCNPLLQDCDRGYTCTWAGDSFSCLSTTENLAPGEPCDFIDECAPGLFCIEDEELPDCAGIGCCTSFCSIERGEDHCQIIPGTTCVPFFPEGTAPPGLEDVGVCVSP